MDENETKHVTFTHSEISSYVKSTASSKESPTMITNSCESTSSTGNVTDRDHEQLSDSVKSDFSKVRIFKIIVIGDSNVGKTCLTYRFCEGKFPEKTEATIGVDFREKTIKIGEDILKLQIWDTAGQERFRRSMVQHYYRNAHAVVFVYDVTRMQTFENLTIWMDECQANGVNSDVPRIVIGNKCDAEKHVIPTSLAQRFADGRQMPLFETSAKDNSKTDHVESIFLTLAHKLHSSKPMYLSSANDEALKLKRYDYKIKEVDSTSSCWC